MKKINMEVEVSIVFPNHHYKKNRHGTKIADVYIICFYKGNYGTEQIKYEATCRLSCKNEVFWNFEPDCNSAIEEEVRNLMDKEEVIKIFEEMTEF